MREITSPDPAIVVKSKPKDITIKEVTEYLCAFCRFVFTTKAGYMEHTKLGQCAQVRYNITLLKLVLSLQKKINFFTKQQVKIEQKINITFF